MTMADLIGGVIGLALVFALAFAVWRWRRLHLRRGVSDLEYFDE